MGRQIGAQGRGLHERGFGCSPQSYHPARLGYLVLHHRAIAREDPLQAGPRHPGSGGCPRRDPRYQDGRAQAHPRLNGNAHVAEVFRPRARTRWWASRGFPQTRSQVIALD